MEKEACFRKTGNGRTKSKEERVVEGGVCLWRRETLERQEIALGRQMAGGVMAFIGKNVGRRERSKKIQEHA